MKERKMSRKAIEEAVRNVADYNEDFFIGTAGISVMSGAIISKIDTVIMEMGAADIVETYCYNGEWFINRKRRH